MNERNTAGDTVELASAGTTRASSGLKPDELLSADFLAKLFGLSLVSRKILAGKLRGERRSRKRGQSLEFADFRSYTQGDDLRHIDWLAYGRLERLFLKLFHDEEDLSVYLVPDMSLSMGAGEANKSGFVRRAAAAIACIGLNKGDRITVFTQVNGKDFMIKDQRGGARTLQVFDFLCRLPVGGETDLNALASRFLVSCKRPGICVILSDLMDPGGVESFMRRLVAAGMDVFVIHTLSPEEVEPDMVGEWRLMDIETGAPVDISASPRLLNTYRETVRKFCVHAKDIAVRLGAHYLFTTTDTPFEHLVLRFLRHVGLVR